MSDGEPDDFPRPREIWAIFVAADVFESLLSGNNWLTFERHADTDPEAGDVLAVDERGGKRRLAFAVTHRRRIDVTGYTRELIGVTLAPLPEVPPPVDGWEWSRYENANEVGAWSEDLGHVIAELTGGGRFSLKASVAAPEEILLAVVRRLHEKAGPA